MYPLGGLNHGIDMSGLSEAWKLGLESQPDHSWRVHFQRLRHLVGNDCSRAGCMTYGSPEWQPWVLGEKETFEHIKYACVVYHSRSPDVVR